MCVFFSCLVTRQGEVRFCEDESHETTIKRLGLDDTRPLATRGWLRVERPYVDRAWQDVRVDETSAPAWWNAEMAARVEAVSERVLPAKAAYEAASAPAWAASVQARVAYDAACVQAWAADKAARASAQTARVQARVAYDAACAQAQRVHNEVYAQAWAAYVAAISTIEGYVPEAPC